MQQLRSRYVCVTRQARAFLESSGVPFNGEEQWAVVKTSKGHDWVQAPGLKNGEMAGLSLRLRLQEGQ